MKKDERRRGKRSEKSGGQDKGVSAASRISAQSRPNPKEIYTDCDISPAETLASLSACRSHSLCRFKLALARIPFDVRVLTMLALTLSAFWVGGYRINYTPSAPLGLYRLTPGPLVRGAWVVACLPEDVARFGHTRGYLFPGHCPGKVAPVLKQLVALAGDVVEQQPGSITVNGVALPQSATLNTDMNGLPLSHPAWGTHHVAAGEVWLLSPKHARSWDSRYYGPLPERSILGPAHPVLTLF